MIEARQIGVYKAGKALIQNISLTINSGEVFAVLGPNGAGKSTLLNCLSAGSNPDKGSVLWDKKKTSDFSLREKAKYRSVLSQSNEINFPFRVKDIVMMGRYPYHLGYETLKDQDIIKTVMEHVGIESFSDRLYFTLSGGEKQRVHMARAIAQIWTRERPCLFLDEPTNALDLNYQKKILTLISHLKVEKQASIICVIHDLNLALLYADKAVLLKEGDLISYGRPQDILTEENIEKTYNVTVKCHKTEKDRFFISF